MKKINILLLLLFVTTYCFSQKAVDWNYLSKVRWHKGYVESLKGYFDLPNFDPSISELDKKTITIQGFYVPIDMEGTMFALSKTPSNQCFFCDAGGIETVMEINVKKGHSKLKGMGIDKYIQVRGTLHINIDDPAHLMYVLKDAELVSVVK